MLDSPLQPAEAATTTAPRERAISFTEPNLLAILDGRKTMTRRIIDVDPDDYPYVGSWHQDGGRDYVVFADAPDDTVLQRVEQTIRYVPGDRLWIRETHYAYGHWETVDGVLTKGGQQKWRFVDQADVAVFTPPPGARSSMNKAFPGLPAWYKRNARFMPRRYARTFLDVTDAKVERLQDISEEDALAEGRMPCRRCGDCGWINSGPDGGWQCDMPGCGDSDIDWFAGLWNSIHGPDAWDKNPWVSATTLKLVAP